MGNAGQGLENRKQPRAPLELRVDYQRMNTFFADYTKNLSKGGTFIKTRTPLPVGTTLVFRLGIPTLPDPVDLRGEVSWTLDSAAAEHARTDPGMGIRFLFDDDAQKYAFEDAIERLMIQHLGEGIYRQLVGKD